MYNKKEFEGTVANAIEHISLRRNTEIKYNHHFIYIVIIRLYVLIMYICMFVCIHHRRREEFMNDIGKHLPPLFFDIVPSLAKKPQFFNGGLTEVNCVS